jgi:hypothetical protein
MNLAYATTMLFFLFFYEMVTKIAMRSNDFTLVPVITLTQRICFPEVTMPLLQFGRQVTLFPGSRQGLILTANPADTSTLFLSYTF